MAGGKRVLSIQSHVVSGYVGNKSAIFPLQVLGFEVDYINTVELSCHVAYPFYDGQIYHGNELKKLYEGLKRNELHHYSHLLTGYIGSLSFAEELVNVVRDLKEINPDLQFVCDPVMGDNGRMYVPKELSSLYRDQLIQLADIITPNQYELQLLTGIDAQTMDEALTAMQMLHDKGVQTVILSSARLKDFTGLTLVASSLNGGARSVIKMHIPELSAIFLGTGDLFTACVLGWMSKSNGNLKVSCENAINTMQKVLHRTYDYAKELTQPGEEMSWKNLELKIIQSKDDIENPEQILTADIF